jgi:rubredoxin
MAKWICPDCDYVYDPAFAFLTSGVAPRTQFDDLADDWKCPQCRAGKERFIPRNRADLPEPRQAPAAGAKAA